MRAPTLLLASLALAGALGLLAAGPASAADRPDISLTLTLQGGGVTREVGADVILEATVVNHGNVSTAPFKVDVWATGQGSWPRQSLSFPGLAAGANVTIERADPYRATQNGPVFFRGAADPAGAVDDANVDNNSFNFEVNFVSYETLEVGSKLASSTPLESGDCLVFEVELRDGESILFNADTREGAARVDQYLLDEENWENFRRALREGNVEVTYFSDFSQINTNHVLFTTAPLPAGHYYLVLDNAAILQHGAKPAGETTVTYSIARVGSGLPFELIFIVIAAGAGAVYFTLRWRPSFESSEAVLAVPPPALGVLAPEEEEQEEGVPDSGPDAEDGGNTPPDDTGAGDDAPEGRADGPPRRPRN